MATAPEKDVDVLLRSDQKLLLGNEGPERNLLGRGAGPRSSHLPEGDETCEGLSTTAESSSREAEQGQVLFSSGLPENQALANDFG